MEEKKDNSQDKKNLNKLKNTNSGNSAKPSPKKKKSIFGNNEIEANTSNNSNNNDIHTDAQFGQSLDVLEEILAICQGHTNVNYPLCDNCMKNVLTKLDNQLQDLNLEQRQYKNYVTDYENSKQNLKVLSPRMRNANNYDLPNDESKEEQNVCLVLF